MFEGFTYTDWLLIVVLWFQIAIVLSLWWPRLSRLRHRNGIPSEITDAYSKDRKAAKKDAYETLFGGEKE